MEIRDSFAPQSAYPVPRACASHPVQEELEPRLLLSSVGPWGVADVPPTEPGFTQAAAAAPFDITTETGTFGADTYVSNYDNTATGGTSSPDANFGTDDNMIAWEFTEDARYKVYVRFDLSSVTEPLGSATLALTTIDGQFSDGTMVWGLNDGDAGELWDEMAMTWNNAPANDMGGAAFLGNATFLGHFQNVVNAPGGTGDFPDDALKDFLNADTNGVVTLMFASLNGFTYLAPKEHPAYSPPTLTLATGTTVPGDLDGDGFVGQADLDIVLGEWGNSPPSDLRADPDGNGTVGQGDLDTVLAGWGRSAGPGIEMNGSWYEQTPTRERFCLNGQWLFQPLPGDTNGDWQLPPVIAEVDGYDWYMTMRVPGTWKAGLWGHDTQFLSPSVVSQLETSLRAWYKRSFFVPADWDGKNIRLEFEGVGYKGEVYVNRQHAGTHIGGLTPFDVDITPYVIPGEVNEVLVYNTSFRRGWETPVEGVLVPGDKYGGIWGDAYLRATDEVFTDDAFVKPSVRQGEVTVDLEILNTSGTPQTVFVENVVMDGAITALTMPLTEITIPAGQMVELSVQQNWLDPQYWSVEDPHLYFLHTRIHGSGGLLDEQATRFGFREFWIDGKDFRLNGEIVRLRNFPYIGEGLAQMRDEYLRGWFTLMKDQLHHNSIRAFNPVPDAVARIADEVGLLIAQGTSLVGGSQYLWDSSVHNTTRRREIGELVRARRNHPSIVIWDAENECWSMVDVAKYNAGDPEAIGIYNWLLGVSDWIGEHDDTRPISYHNLGDMFDWTEGYMEEFFEAGDLMGAVDHYNLHYPNFFRYIAEQADVGAYWALNKNKPLIVGEFSGPQTNIPGNTTDFTISGEAFVTGGVAQGESSYYVFRRLVGAWRAAGVSGIFAWWPNAYSVKKAIPDPHTFAWDDLTTPGPKPATVPYAWYNPDWDDARPTYIPDNVAPEANFGFWDLLDDTFAPLLIQLGGDYWEHNYLSGELVTKTASIVNDTPGVQPVMWSWALEDDGVWLAGETLPAALARAEIRPVGFDVQLPVVTQRTELKLILTATVGADSSTDELDITVYPAAAVAPPAYPAANIALYDTVGITAGVLTQAGIAYEQIADIATGLNPGVHTVLIIGADSADASLRDVVPANVIQQIQSFTESGGTVLVFEQGRTTYGNLHQIFPGIVTPGIEHGSVPYAPYSYADVGAAGHPMFDGLKDGISLWQGEHGRISEFVYPRPFGTTARSLLFSGKWGASLIEGTQGTGRYVLSQVNLSTRYGQDPEATILMHNMLSYALAPPPVVQATAATVGPIGGLLGEFTSSTLSPGFMADDITGQLATADLTGYDVLILGDSTLSAGSEVTANAARILSFAAGGGTVFVLDQDPQTFTGDWLPGEVAIRATASQYIHKAQTASPLTWGVSAFDLTRFYRYLGTYELLNEWPLPKVAAEWNSWSGDWTSLLLVSDAPANWNVGTMEPVGGVFPTGGSAMLQAAYGAGSIVLCQLDLDANAAAVLPETLEHLDYPNLSPRMLTDTLLANLGLTPAVITGPFEISTGDGLNGADTYVSNYDNTGTGGSISPDTNFGANDHMIAWDFTEDARYKIYVRFDLSSVTRPLASATLTATTIDGQFAAGTTVWGLNDGDAGEFWDEMTISWNNAPANDMASGTGFLPNATYLGSFANISNVAGGTGDLSSVALTNFLDADTNNAVTLMFASASGFTYLAAKENATFLPPTLTLEQGEALAAGLSGDGFVEQAAQETASAGYALQTDGASWTVDEPSGLSRQDPAEAAAPVWRRQRLGGWLGQEMSVPAGGVDLLAGASGRPASRQEGHPSLAAILPQGQPTGSVRIAGRRRAGLARHGRMRTWGPLAVSSARLADELDIDPTDILDLSAVAGR